MMTLLAVGFVKVWDTGGVLVDDNRREPCADFVSWQIKLNLLFLQFRSLEGNEHFSSLIPGPSNLVSIYIKVLPTAGMNVRFENRVLNN